MNNIGFEQSKEICKHQKKVYCIAPSAQAVADFARSLDVPRDRLVWVSGPDDLQGLKNPDILTLPNWWMHPYKGMEEMLNIVEAQVHTVNYFAAQISHNLERKQQPPPPKRLTE